MSIAYLNGVFSPLEETCISPLDRGFLFGDGVYEVIPVYGGRPFRLKQHLKRLQTSLAAIRVADPLTPPQWAAVLAKLVAKNGGGEQSIYLQVTRGAAPREHAFPTDTPPTVLAMSHPVVPVQEVTPLAAVTRPDYRWTRCDIKTISLLGNVLLRQEAVEAGCVETILLRDGRVTEGAASNVFIVNADFVVTPAKGPLLLAGITRDLVIELCTGAGLPCIEGAVSERDLREANEVWLTSSTREVVPVTQLDGKPVGTGRPGPVWNKVWRLYQRYKQRVA